MARYANIDEVLHNVPVDDMGNVDFITLEKVLMKSTTDVVPKSDFEKQKLEIWRLQGEVEQLRHRHELAVAEREANVRGFTEELQKAKAEVERLEAELAKAKEKADRLFVNLKAVLEERAEEWKEGERYEANDET